MFLIKLVILSIFILVSLAEIQGCLTDESKSFENLKRV
jgi:hypothetical protein